MSHTKTDFSLPSPRGQQLCEPWLRSPCAPVNVPTPHPELLCAIKLGVIFGAMPMKWQRLGDLFLFSSVRLKLISVSNQQWKGSGERERLGCSPLGICEQSAIACAWRHPMEQEAQEGQEDKAG